MRYSWNGGVAIITCVAALISCNPFGASSDDRDTSEKLSEMVRPERSWIGISMYEKYASDDDRIASPPVIVDMTVPGAPADGILHERDEILQIDGKPVGSVEDVVAFVGDVSPGTELSVLVRTDASGSAKKAPKRIVANVKIHTARKPVMSEYFSARYAGKTLPAPGAPILTAEVGSQGAVIPGSQCTIKKKNACPPFGNAKDMSLAAGEVTVVVFWSAWSYFLNVRSEVFDVVGRWRTQYGAQRIAIVAVSSGTAGHIGKYVAATDGLPPMRLLHVEEEGLDKELSALLMFHPSAVVLGKDGHVLSVCRLDDDPEMKACERAIGGSFGTIR